MIPDWLQPFQQQLQRLLLQQQLAHALLFTGPDGVGKSVLAGWLAAALLCKADRHIAPCGQCKSCLLRQAGNHPDLLTPQVSGQKTGIEQIRQLTAFLQNAAQQAGARVVLLRNAHSMTEAAANALLKTLEEPTPGSFILLQSAQPSQLPATILSRCQRWALPAVFEQQAATWLSHHSNRPVPDFLLRYTAGGPLKALEMLENGQADHIQQLLQQLDLFFKRRLALPQLVKQLEQVDEVSRLLGWYIGQQMLPAIPDLAFERQQAIIQRYTGYCRDEQQILGQNKTLAYTALLTDLQRLRG